MPGAEMDRLDDAGLVKALDTTDIFARVSPTHKVRIVEAIKQRGEVVAMTGDGVNDAPALKRADIGIAMGITGTEVTKEAAAMILTDDDFSTIVKAVRIGRGLYDNLKKYIKFQMAALIGFIVTFLGASIFNVASGVETSLLDLATMLLHVMGSGLSVAHGPTRAVNGVTRRLADTRAAKEGIGFEAQVDLEEGLGRLVEWWAEHRSPDRLEKVS